jgi:hypothetical protein
MTGSDYTITYVNTSIIEGKKMSFFFLIISVFIVAIIDLIRENWPVTLFLHKCVAAACFTFIDLSHMPLTLHWYKSRYNLGKVKCILRVIMGYLLSKK